MFLNQEGLELAGRNMVGGGMFLIVSNGKNCVQETGWNHGLAQRPRGPQILMCVR